MNYRSEIKAFARKSLFANYGAVLGTYLFSAAPGIVLFSITMFFSVISAVFLNLDSYSIFSELVFYGSTMLNQISSMLYELFTYLLLPFTSVGIAAYMLLLIRGDRKKFTFPYAFGWKRYAPFLGGCLLVNLLTFLWMLLFIIPGIVKGYAYSFTPYILADCPPHFPYKRNWAFKKDDRWC